MIGFELHFYAHRFYLTSIHGKREGTGNILSVVRKREIGDFGSVAVELISLPMSSSRAP